MPDKVFQRDVGDTAITSIRLEHKHLVARPCVDVSVRNIRDSSASSKTAHTTTTTPVTINIFHQNVLRRRLDSNAFVLVSHHDIVDPNIVTPDIDAVETALVAAADGHVVDFAICAGVDGEVEGGGVDEGDVVDGEVGYIPDA